MKNINYWYLFLISIIIINLFIFIFYNKIIEGYSSNIEMYVITLKHEDRLKNIKLQQDKIDQTIQIFDAVKGDILNTDDLLKDGLIDIKYSTNDKADKRVIGCYMSHLNIIKQINDSETSGYTIIFEDDFDIIPSKFMKKVRKIIKKLEKQNIDFDILFLGNLKSNHGERVYENIYKIDKKESLWGTHGYLINNSKIDRILDKIKFIDMPIDDKYEYLGKNGELNIYLIYPTIVNQQSNKFASTINEV